MKKSCIACHHFTACKDPQKSIIFHCTRFKRTADGSDQEKAFLEDILDRPFVTSTTSNLLVPKHAHLDPNDDTGEFDAYKTLQSVLNDKRIVSPDIKIPEGDFKEAPNFHTWCVSSDFLDQKPFIMQSMIGTKLFAEWCPTCSDVEWMENGLKVGDSLSKFERKVALLEYGNCRYCKKTKLDFFKNGKLNPYYELSLSAGQRCVIGDTLVLTSEGLVEIGDFAGDRPYGYSDFGLRFQTDTTLEQATKFYRARPEKCFSLNTKHGFSVTGTGDHPVMTMDGFIRLSEIVESDYVRVYYGQQVFGNKTPIFKEITQTTDTQFFKYIDGLKNIHKSNVLRPRRRPGCGANNQYYLTEDVARLLGYWVAEGRNRGIANDDPMVIDDCYNTLTSMFSENLIRRKSRGIEFSNTYVQMWLGNLLQFDINGKSAEKQVPRCVLQASKSVQSAFLSALFEGDGCVSRKRIRLGLRYSVGYVSISKKLVDQLSAMLLNFGILHQRRTRKSWATNGSANQVEKDVYCLSITGRFIEDFSNQIGFQSNRKRNLLKLAVHSVQNKVNNVPFYFDKLPASMCDDFYTALSCVRSELSQLATVGSRESIGLQTVFGKGHRTFTRVDRQRTLTRQDIDRFILPLLSDDFMFSHSTRSLLIKLAEYKSSENFYYDSVKSNILTDEKFETFDVTIPGKHRFISNGLLSHNSGKSALAGMLTSYLTHRLIKLERPNEVYGLLKANVLQGTFVALTFRQALDTLWEPFYGHLLEAPWFTQYHQMLLSVQQRHGEDEILKLRDTSVFYRHRRIQVYAAGPDKRVLRGRTRCFSGIDELGWFPNTIEAAKNIKMNANEVYTALERSLLTVRAKAKSVIRSGFYNVPFGYFINISSPSSVRDKIMELVRKSQGSRRMLGLCLPTWKMNPHVPRSALAEEFRTNPETAMRDYGAQPPLTNSPFISGSDKIEPCLLNKVHKLSVLYHTVRSKDKTSSELYTELAEIQQSGKPSVLALDAGYSGNSFSFAIGHRAPNGFPVISAVGETIPTPGIRINHSLLYKHLLSSLIPLRNVVLIAADRWNSLKVLADAEQEFGIEKRQYSLKYADMQLFRSYVDDRQIMLPRPTRPIADILKYDHSKYPECFKHLPADHLILQLLTVQDTGSGIIKGDQLTDDIARAVFLCFRMLTDDIHDDILNAPDAEQAQRFDLSTMVVSKLYSGGGTGSSSGLGGGGGSSLGVLRPRM